jgi:enediyne biosynthesis thioesterase
LKAFDRVVIRMFLNATAQNRIAMRFEYWREGVTDELVGRGEQEIACMQRDGEQLLPTSIPAALQEVLAEFAEAQAS